MKIAPFRIEEYYAVHEFSAPHMLSSSDAESVAIADLLALEPDAAERLFAQRLGYTESAGAPELRGRSRSVRDDGTDDVIVVAAAEEGIFAAYHALLQPGDHAVVETPCYESALQVARSAGAEVTEWRRSAGNGWAHDLDALEAASGPTRGSSTSTAAQPDGLLMPREVLDRVVELCAERGAWLFADEVYRELEHDPADRLPAAVDLYDRAISLGSMSKTYGLPGLRLGGWPRGIVTRSRDRRSQALHDDLLERSERAPQRTRAPASRRVRRPQSHDRARESRARRRVPRSARRSLLVGAADREHDWLRPGRRRR